LALAASSATIGFDGCDAPFLLLVFPADRDLFPDDRLLFPDDRVLLPLELLRLVREPGERVFVCAMFLASLWLPCQQRVSRRRCGSNTRLVAI
jgi:hypothetical protein